jgi:hypothetical protein
MRPATFGSRPAPQPKPLKWSVHLDDGTFVGYVWQTTEEYARLEALSQYGDPGQQLYNKNFSVMER